MFFLCFPQLPKGWIAIDNDGQRFHTPLDHSFPARNMTFFDKGHMEEMFGLHDFEVTGLDGSSNVDAADNCKFKRKLETDLFNIIFSGMYVFSPIYVLRYTSHEFSAAKCIRS